MSDSPDADRFAWLHDPAELDRMHRQDIARAVAAERRRVIKIAVGIAVVVGLMLLKGLAVPPY